MKLISTGQVLVQGTSEILTGKHLPQVQACGTDIAAIVIVGQGGSTWAGAQGDVPIFDLVEQATEVMPEIETTLIFNPAYAVLDAALEAIDGGLRRLIVITGGIPPLDIVRLLRKAKATGTTVLGPGSKGILIPNGVLLGIQEPHFFSPGGVAIVSCYSSLAAEVATRLTKAGLGQSVSINLGSDTILGTDFHRCLEFLKDDPQTEAIALLDYGNSGHSNLCLDSKLLGKYLNLGKPLVAYVAGHLLPREKPIPEIGSVIASQFASTVTTTSNAKLKINALKKAKILIADYPHQIPDLIKKAMADKFLTKSVS